MDELVLKKWKTYLDFDVGELSRWWTEQPEIDRNRISCGGSEAKRSMIMTTMMMMMVIVRQETAGGFKFHLKPSETLYV